MEAFLFFLISASVRRLPDLIKKVTSGNGRTDCSTVCDTEYHGYCHCKAIKFTVKAPKHLVAWNCNCSVCFMKKNWHFIIPEEFFNLTEGEDFITQYTFNTHTAKHQFCKQCGVQAFYRPRSNPDGYAVTLACLDPAEVQSFEIRQFDGENWETFYSQSDIKKFSDNSPS